MSNYVANFDREGVLKYIVEQIKHWDIIVKVVDILDFEATQIQEIYDIAKKEKCELIVIVNKCDCLPRRVSFDRVQKWAVAQIKKQIPGYSFTVCLTSAKKAGGLNKVCTIFERFKKEAKESRFMRPRMYVVGCTNSGKSSFLNAVIHKMSNNPRLKDNQE